MIAQVRSPVMQHSVKLTDSASDALQLPAQIKRPSFALPLPQAPNKPSAWFDAYTQSLWPDTPPLTLFPWRTRLVDCWRPPPPCIRCFSQQASLTLSTVALSSHCFPTHQVRKYVLTDRHTTTTYAILFNSKRYFVLSMEGALIRFAELDKLAQGIATLLPDRHLGLTGERLTLTTPLPAYHESECMLHTTG